MPMTIPTTVPRRLGIQAFDQFRAAGNQAAEFAAVDGQKALIGAGKNFGYAKKSPRAPGPHRTIS